MRRWALLVFGCTVLLGCSPSSPPETSSAPTIEYSEFALVSSGSIVNRLPYEGVVVPSLSIPLYSTATGTLTRAVAPGTELAAGSVAVFVNEAPVVLFPGDVPVFRDLIAPAGGPALQGPDVTQLQAFLQTAGYYNGTLGGPFTGSLGEASRRWRLDHGMSDLRGFAAAEAIFVPGPGPWQVTESTLELGATFSGGLLITVASGPPAVSVTMDTPPPAESVYAVLPLPGQSTPEIPLQVSGPTIRDESGAYIQLLMVEQQPEGAGLILGQAVVVERRQILAADVTSIPVSAVRIDSSGDTVVACREPGSTQVRECPVDLGATDGSLVEVRDGLDLGTEVAVSP